MKKEIIKIGSSLAIIFPAAIVQQANLHEGDEVMLDSTDRQVVIRRCDLVTPVDLRGKVAPSTVTMKDLRNSRRRISRSLAKKWNAT